MSVEAFLGRLPGGVRRNGTGWIAYCPAHEDRTPSLSISVGDGRILFKCQAGCSQEAVLAAFATLGIKKRELFLDAGKREPQNDVGESKRVKPKIVKTYDYSDEEGTLLYQKVRYEPRSAPRPLPTP